MNYWRCERYELTIPFETIDLSLSTSQVRKYHPIPQPVSDSQDLSNMPRCRACKDDGIKESKCHSCRDGLVSKQTCRKCGPSSQPQDCLRCQATGRKLFNGHRTTTTCGYCSGTGKLPPEIPCHHSTSRGSSSGEVCGECGGYGTVAKHCHCSQGDKRRREDEERRRRRCY